MRHEYTVTQHAAFYLHRITDNAIIANTHLPAQVGIGADTAIFTDTHMPLYHRTGFDNGAFDRRNDQAMELVNRGTSGEDSLRQ